MSDSKALKTKILVILFIGSIASAVVTGGLLIFLLKYVGASGNLSVVLAIGIYFLSGLFLLVLLNVLLGKNIIMPEVERKMLDNERAMLNEQLQHSQKMEAVGRLAGSIAHDFNNLLTIIDGYSSLIIADPKSSETEQNAREVVEAARKASFITRKLLSFSQKEKPESVLLDLNVMLSDADKMLARLIGEKINLVAKSYPEPLHVRADPVQMGQVLMNLAVNASDAMPGGGRISIKVDCRDISHGECGKPDKLAEGKYAEIAVRDTGHGIDEEMIGRIFEPFFTTKGSGKGTGLGLSIVKSIMKENDGFVGVRSKIGNGTTFLLYLPVADTQEVPVGEEEPVAGNAAAQIPEAGAAEEPEESNEADAPRKPTVLLVEDDAMIRNLVSQTLEMQEYTVLLAEEGWEGVKISRNHKGAIDLLFTDVVMPGMGGVELAVAVREMYPEVKVLYMSGYSRSQLEDEEGVPADAAILEKPFTPDKVVAKVRKVLAG